MTSKFPKAYTSDVKKDESLMQYVSFDTMGIGARKSGLAKDPGALKSLEHVGQSAGMRGGDKK